MKREVRNSRQQANSDVFSWSAIDMLGVNPQVIIHKLNVLLGEKSIKQKKRRFVLKVVEVVRQEVAKLLSVGFIKKVEYSGWVSNMACPKESFPLPSIDRLVDASAGCRFMSSMDAFLGCNQILLDQDDLEKTTFITEKELFYYRVMPFGLKNT
ncbi:Transposon Ty3-G Gag-Pol polyprotein [Gossypium australe]|uniref:Transposon Ty3-G Gag-Pol polyprotein n=1 Tax=Gossypium australe TaxID=47621 RepID=A0A5B6UZP4_9ROSI|nr:Transposon Ty3-G Gag-Pol polyprotein [Gossypium australe]